MKKALRNRRITTAITARELRAIRWAANLNAIAPSLLLRAWSVKEIASEYEQYIEARKMAKAAALP